MAQRFCYVSLGILALAIAFALGAHSARGQGVGSTIAGFTVQPNAPYDWAVVLPNGDIYTNYVVAGGGVGAARYEGNFWGANGPTATPPSSWGSIKRHVGAPAPTMPR